MSKNKHIFKNVIRMSAEDKALTKRIVDYMFSDMKGIITVANINYKWGRIPEECWEDAYSELYINISKYIGREIDGKITAFSYLGRATAKYLFQNGFTSVKAKRVRDTPIPFTHVFPPSGISLPDSEKIDYYVNSYGKNIPKTPFDEMNESDTRRYIKHSFKNDKDGIIEMLYDGHNAESICRAKSLSRKYVHSKITSLRQQYILKSRTLNNE